MVTQVGKARPSCGQQIGKEQQCATERDQLDVPVGQAATRDCLAARRASRD
jgi:hypothetical protein